MDEQDDLVVCGICAHPYDNDERIPKFLACFHSYCATCLGHVHRRSGSFECPVCRTVTPGADPMALTTNFYVTKFMEVLQVGSRVSGARASPPSGATGTSSAGMRPRIARRSRNVTPAAPPTTNARDASPEAITNRYLKDFCSPARRSRLDRDLKCYLCLEHIASSCAQCSEDAACPVVQLMNCFDAFHQHCLERHFGGNQPEYFECPLCQTLQGVKMGNQPANGQMYFVKESRPLPGFNACGRITITFSFTVGIQDADGPHPGRPYDISGFPKTCYLPDNEDGNDVLKLLQEAFRRRILFRIETIGGFDRVTFGQVKLKIRDYPSGDGYGYPDDKYLNLVRMELNTLGIVAC